MNFVKLNYIAISSVFAMILLSSLTVHLVSASSTTVTDPAGDVKNNVFLWQDIVGGSASKQGSEFSFSMTLAGSLPSSPPLPEDTKALLWIVALDTDGSTFPAGYPFTKNSAKAFEYLVQLIWDGTTFVALVIDRTPLLSGGEATLTLVPVSFSGDRATISILVSASLIGDPSSFAFFLATANRGAPIVQVICCPTQVIPLPGNNGYQLLDRAPNPPSWAQWPS